MNYGRYQIISEIGKGSMGVVYKAHDPQIDRVIALKVLRQDRVADSGLTRRFLTEARAIGRLTHGNIVTVYDIGQDHGTVYIAMEFIEGRQLAEMIQDGPLPLGQATRIGSQVAEAIHYAHGQGIVHRDIKPANIIVTAEGRVKVTDFGIARIEGSAGLQHTQVGDILGTPFYMSPEQVAGRPVDGRSDIYALGVVLYEMTSGRRPFGGDNQGLATLFRAIAEETPAALSRTAPDIPGPFFELVMRCLAKNPQDRFQSGRELVEALSTGPDPRGAAAPAPKAVPAAVPERKKRGRIGLMAAGVVLCAVLAVIAWNLYMPMLSPPAPKSESPAVAPPADIQKQDNTPTKQGTSDKPGSISTSPEPKPIPKSASTGGIKVEPATPVPKAQPASEPAPVPPVPKVQKKSEIASQTPAGGEPDRPATHSTKTAAQPKQKLDLQPSQSAKKTPADHALSAKKTDSAETDPVRTPTINGTTAGEMGKEVLLGAMKVESVPPGARLYVDGQFRGETPLKLELPYGKYDLRLNLDRFYEWKAQLELKNPRVIPIRARLAPMN